MSITRTRRQGSVARDHVSSHRNVLPGLIRVLGIEELEERALLSASLSIRQANQPLNTTPAVFAQNDSQVTDSPIAGALTPPGTVTISAFFSENTGHSEAMAFDTAGNLYVTNGANDTISKVTPTGTVSTFVSGLCGSLAFDAAGNLYVSNAVDNTISKVTPAGAVSTFVSSDLDEPMGMAFDSVGNLYVANFAYATNDGGNAICKITPEGLISTFVSSGIDFPASLVFDNAGNLYVTGGGGRGPGTISKVTPAGVLSTLVNDTWIENPTGLAFDAAGNLYVASGAVNAICKVTLAGIVSPYVTSGLNAPASLAIDSAGDLYVSTDDYGNCTIAKITPQPPVVEGQAFNGTVFHFTDFNPAATAGDYTAVVALGDGNGVTLNSGGVVNGPAGAGGQIVADTSGGFDVELSYTYAKALNNQTFSVQVTAADGASTSASSSTFSVAPQLTADALTPPGTPTASTFVSYGLNCPSSLAFDAAGNLYITNVSGTDMTSSGMISKVTPAGTVSTFVNNDHGLWGFEGMAFDAAGNLYVAGLDDDYNRLICKVTPTGAISTFVSNSVVGFASLAFDGAGNLYATDGEHTVWKVTPAGAMAEFVSSGLDIPNALAFDAAGNLYVTNEENNTISKATPAGVVSTFVSGGLDDPDALAFDNAGNLYVANDENNTISKVTPAGAVSTFVSGGIDNPSALAFDAAGNLYVANFSSNTISKLTPTEDPIEGQAFSGTVFHFTDAKPTATASDYTAVVTLGDGNSVSLNSNGVVRGPASAGGRIVADAGGGFDVELSYTYAEALNNRPFSVQVTDVDGSSTSAGTAITVVGPVSVSKSTMAVWPSAIASGGTNKVTLTARDANGNQEPRGGLTVKFALGTGSAGGNFGPVTDNGNGTYTATFTGTHVGSGTITASIGGKAVTSTRPTLTVVGTANMSRSTVAMAATSVAVSGTETVMLTARDALGHQDPIGGLKVAFGLGSGSASGTFSAVTDNLNGTYTATLTGISAGSNTVTATIDGKAVTSTPPTVIVVGPASVSRSTVTVSASRITAGSAVTVTLTARDALGHQEPSGGSTVLFNLGSGKGGGRFGWVTDNGNGTYTATFTGTTVGSNNITATIDGQPITSTLPTVTVTKVVAGIAATPALDEASTNHLAIDTALRTLLLDESTMTGKPRRLLGL